MQHAGGYKMAKELMWICALLPEKRNQELTDICKKENQTLGLPEDVFRFPLHISMKKSFQTTDFDKVKEEILMHMQAYGKIRCNLSEPVLHKKMIWLPVASQDQILEWHDKLDEKLLNKFEIPIDRFDSRFQPHISLFTKGSEEQLAKVQELLEKKIQPGEMVLDRFVIGSSRHKDEFYEL
jgi:hypothetical protein